MTIFQPSNFRSGVFYFRYFTLKSGGGTNLSWQRTVIRCQLNLSLFRVKKINKNIIHKVWLYQILLLDLCID